MPRNSKKPGANRTDLLTPGTPPAAPGSGQPNGQPIKVPTGGPYGEAQQLSNAQHAAPMAGSGVPTPGPGPGAGPAQPLDMAQALEDAKNFMPPHLGDLTRPTERPNEPVTAGLPGGPTPITGPPQMDMSNTISAMLSRMGAATGSAALSQLASRAAQVGQ